MAEGIYVTWPLINCPENPLLLDLEDAEKLRILGVTSIRENTGTYPEFFLNGKYVLVHRFVMGCSPGDRLEIDHMYEDTHDARKKHLRIAPHSLNRANNIRIDATGGLSISGYHKIMNIKYKGKTYRQRHSTEYEVHNAWNRIRGILYGVVAQFPVPEPYCYLPYHPLRQYADTVQTLLILVARERGVTFESLYSQLQ